MIKYICMGKTGSNKNQCFLMRLLYFFIVLICLSFYIPNKSGKQDGHTKLYHFHEGDIWETTLANKKGMEVRTIQPGIQFFQVIF